MTISNSLVQKSQLKKYKAWLRTKNDTVFYVHYLESKNSNNLCYHEINGIISRNEYF